MSGEPVSLDHLQSLFPDCPQALLEAACARAASARGTVSPQALDEGALLLAQQWPDVSRDRINTVLASAVELARRPSSPARAGLAVAVKPAPAAPLLRAGDAACAQALEARLRDLHQHLARIAWADAGAAATACVAIAVLRMDVPAHADAITAWLARSLHALCPQVLAEVDAGHWPRLDPVTWLALKGVRDAHPQLSCLGQATSLAQVVGLLAAPGQAHGHVLPALARATQAWCRLHLPVAVHGLLAPGCWRAPSPVSRWALDYGIDGDAATAPAMRSAPIALSLADLPRREPARWLSPVIAQRVLSQLASKLRGLSVARLGERDGPTRAQAIAMLEQARGAHPWGALEILVLAWGQRRLSDPATHIKPTSLSRYLSALSHLVIAQGHQPLITQDPDTGLWQADAQRWRQILDELVRRRPDSMVMNVVAQLGRQLQAIFPMLEYEAGDLAGDLEGQARPGELIMPATFEAVAQAHWALGSATAQHAVLAAACAYYLGWRVSEVRGLLVGDVLDEAALLMQVRAHRARHTKTRHAARLVIAQAWLPPHWAQRLRERIAKARATTSDPRQAYLLPDPADPASPLPVQSLDLLVGALRAHTGNAQLTFHNLRHAAASVSFLRLILWRHPQLRAFPCHGLGEDVFSPDAVAQWIAGWLPGDAALSAGVALHELARAMGHGHPATTFRWYVHVVDLAERGLTGLALPVPSRAALRAMLGLDARAFARLEKRARARQRRRLGADQFLPTAWALAAALSPGR